MDTAATDDLNQVSYTLSYQDVLAAYRLASTGRPWLALVWAALAAAILATAAKVDAGASLTVTAIVALLAFAAALLLQWLSQRLSLPATARRVFDKQEGLRDAITLIWRADGLAWTTKRVRNKHPWSDFARCRESADMLLFYRADDNFYMLPKRVLTSAQASALRPFIDAINHPP